MAWIISKTENFLNNLDHSASSALTNDDSLIKSHVNGSASSANQSFNTSYETSNYTNSNSSSFPTSASAHSLSATDLATTSNIKRTPSESTLNANGPSAVPKTRSGSGTSSVTNKLNQDKEDEKLFEFLNSGPSLTGAGTDKRKEKRLSGGGRHSRQSSTSSTVSSRSVKTEGLVMNVAETNHAQNNTGSGKLFLCCCVWESDEILNETWDETQGLDEIRSWHVFPLFVCLSMVGIYNDHIIHSCIMSAYIHVCDLVQQKVYLVGQVYSEIL